MMVLKFMFAGNGGTDLRAGELVMANVKTEEEAIELTGAYLQYYRETAEYLEIELLNGLSVSGLSHVKEVLAKSNETQEGLK